MVIMDGGKELLGNFERKLEDVDQFIEHAKLSSDELASETQVLYFSDVFEDYVLLELNPAILDAVSEGQKLVFRGEQNKNAVLCSDSSTFEVLAAETSNSSLLLPSLNIISADKENTNNDQRYLEKRKIEGVFYSYLELRKVKPPHINELEILLGTCPYSGPENEYLCDDSSGKLYSTDELLVACHSSLHELTDALKAIGACSVNGHWRILDFNFHLRILSQFLNLVYSNSWPLDAVPETETIEALSDIFPEVIVKHVFSQYTNPNFERNDEGDALFSLKEDKVCRFLGEALLRDGGDMDFDLLQFKEAWQSSVPEGMTTELQQLAGLGVIFESNKVSKIKLCCEKDLPRNIHERIKHLFVIKKKWTLDELTPYIRPLLPEKGNVKTAIMKYAYETVTDGIKWYIERM